MNDVGGKARQIEHVTVGLSDVEAGAIAAALAFALAHGAFEEPQHRAQAVRAQAKIDQAIERGSR
jgi:hypothetical protein